MTMPARQILFADDDVLTQWVIGEVLTSAGFSVTSACRGAEVLDLLEDSPDFDLLLMEAALPDNIDGRRLTDRWMAVLPGRPVIYSSRSWGATCRMHRQHEFFIAKPIDAAKLLRLVDWALDDAMVRPHPILPSTCVPHVH